MAKKYFSPQMLRKMQKGRSSCWCILGHRHDSRLEASHCPIIYDMLKRGEIIDVQRQVNIPLMVNGIKICTHIPDFIVTYPDGHKEIIESKQFPNETWPIKKKLTEATHPEIKYNVWTK